MSLLLQEEVPVRYIYIGKDGRSVAYGGQWGEREDQKNSKNKCRCDYIGKHGSVAYGGQWGERENKNNSKNKCRCDYMGENGSVTYGGNVDCLFF